MEAERVRAQLDRILASTAFTDAERASSFLRFIVDRALSGRAGEIKESVVAVEALGRNPSFDPKSDPSVRVEARRLRDRLDSFYRREGTEDRILISLPKGGYVPEFAERRPPVVPVAKMKYSAMSRAGWALFGLTVLALVWFHFRKVPESAGTFLLSILPPGNASFESFAISPDGRTLAFTAAWNGRIMLWVRALDALESKPLAGTEYASLPFWSADSRRIGFFTTSKLKTIGVTGGPTQDVADIVVGRGGTWSREDIIVFGPKPDGTLYQVAANGGTPKPATALDAARSESRHALPQFLPGGRQFLYLAASARPGVSSIRVGSLDGKTSKVLMSADTGAMYAPGSGERPASVLFVHDGALMAQPFDASNLALTGEKTVVVPQIRYRRWRQAGFSVSSNGFLLFQGGSAENRRFTWFDRQGNALAAMGPLNDFAAFSLSPDERHVALWSDNDPATPSTTIWLMDLSRDGSVSRFSEIEVSGPEFAPVWSPDGGELLFSRGDERHMRLLREAVNGGPARNVLDTEGPKFPTDWSSDGRFITFSTQWPDYRDMHTWTMQLGVSSHPRPFSQHSYAELSAYYSPADAAKGPRWIAYTSEETGRNEVYVRNFPSGDRKRQVSTRGGWLPHWRRDGKELFYLAPDGTLMATPVSLGVTFEPGTPQVMFATGLRPNPIQLLMNQYAVAQDGQRFLLNPRTPEGAAGTITIMIPW